MGSSWALPLASNQAENYTIPRAKSQTCIYSSALQHTWSLSVGNKSTFKSLNATTGKTEATVVRRITSQTHFWVRECRAFPIENIHCGYKYDQTAELIGLFIPMRSFLKSWGLEYLGKVIRCYLGKQYVQWWWEEVKSEIVLGNYFVAWSLENVSWNQAFSYPGSVQLHHEALFSRPASVYKAAIIFKRHIYSGSWGIYAILS